MRTWRGWGKRLRPGLPMRLGPPAWRRARKHRRYAYRRVSTQWNDSGRGTPQGPHRSGWLEQVRQAVRDDRGFPQLEGWARDAKYAMRALLRTPGFSVVALAVMAIALEQA